jgi:lipid-A-disaccharide synthase-like uncharacterized protein
MTGLFEVLGMVGIGISTAAYLPQVVHLAKEHCSAGISVKAWAMWLTSSVLVGSLAIYRQDYVFTALAVSSLLSSALILMLARRFRGMTCETHRPPAVTTAS